MRTRHAWAQAAWLVLVVCGLLMACLGGCSSSPVLTVNEAVPSGHEDLDEATGLVSRRHVSNFKLCVQRSKLVDDAALAGTAMDLVFTITPEGRAKYVKLVSKNFQGTAFASCSMRIINWIVFPDFRGDSRQVRLRLMLDETNPVPGSK
jgi:hypothetical protein